MRVDKPHQPIEEQLIRYRIEKKMAGRRDLMLHGLVYVAVALIVLLNQPGLMNSGDLPILGGLWTIPLILHGLRYYYRCGPGAARRADEIESAIDEQQERSALDDEEELLLEERVSKRVTARRVLVAHGLFSLMFLAVYLPFAFHELRLLPDDVQGYLTAVFSGFGLIFALHATRFFFVHGRTPAGRALKIDAEIEREWHQSRQRSRERRAGYAAASDDDAIAALELGDKHGRRMRLSAEGELELLADERADSAQASMGQA